MESKPLMEQERLSGNLCPNCLGPIEECVDYCHHGGIYLARESKAEKLKERCKWM